MTRVAGKFVLQDGTPIVVASNPELMRIAHYLADVVHRTRAIKLAVVADDAAKTPGAIRLMLAAHGAFQAEGYQLEVRPSGVEISAQDPRGLFYGAVTLWQLATLREQSNGPVELPALHIEDAPQLPWRGFMLDVARHYMPPEFIKQMLDWMALHKLNMLHWHLTDDQGWRLQILKYPRLTEVGARGVSQGYYTQEQVRDIVRYAGERFITVVPEIDIPGHAQAAIAAYPRLGTEGAPPAVSADWGVHTYLLNADEQTFAFLEDVLSEVMALFPSQYLHLGGDEAVKDRWRASPRVQQRMRELGVADETALQGYFVRRLERFLAGHGRKLLGWDEILEGGLPPQATVMSWRGTKGALQAAREGHDVVLATDRLSIWIICRATCPTSRPGARASSPWRISTPSSHRAHTSWVHNSMPGPSTCAPQRACSTMLFHGSQPWPKSSGRPPSVAIGKISCIACRPSSSATGASESTSRTAASRCEPRAASIRRGARRGSSWPTRWAAARSTTR